MKSHLSHILPVSTACEILGRPTVERIVSSLLNLRYSARRKESEEDIREELDSLVDALFYTPPPPPSTPSGESDVEEVEPRVPPAIEEAWKRWLTARPLAMDKTLLIQFLVPKNAQPHAGPSGHMGLFDCWIYTLQGHAPSSSATYYGGAASQLVVLPDVLIVLAVCQEYRSLQEEDAQAGLSAASVDLNDQQETDKTTETTEASTEATTEEAKPSADNAGSSSDPKTSKEERVERIVWTMAVLAYRMYDSYQKKGIVARDTVHRFLTDVHGEDSYKEPKAQGLLDQIFDDSAHEAGWLQASVSETVFCKRVVATKVPGRSHLLLDWMSLLACAMIPEEDLPPSVAAYLDTMEHQPSSISDMYALADHRLFEIKRRFHSMVQSSSPIIQGDPMGTSTSAGASGISSAASTATGSAHPPRHVIRQDAFCEAVSSPNEELGHGGYMQESLARLVFAAGCRKDIPPTTPVDGSKLYWNLLHVLQFGCTAVRRNTSQPEDMDVPLLRFVFSVFQQPEISAIAEEPHFSPLMMGEDASESSLGGGGGDTTIEDITAAEEAKRVLSRAQISRMLLSLVEYAGYRQEMDDPKDFELEEEEEEEGNKAIVKQSDGTIELDVENLSLLGLLPQSLMGGDRETIDLVTLVDHTLKEVSASNEEFTFEQFCAWNKSSTAKPLADEPDGPPLTRLGPFLLELRLVSAVRFGIPPTLASMEVGLIGEIEHRHRCRYPQSDVSRRGPRGTVWYLIDVTWFSAWASLVKQVAGTFGDENDGRGDKDTEKVRGLGRISNTGLLVENGSLALRGDIRWKHDYEILPPLAWSALQAWYDGGPPIYRTVVRYISSTGPSSPHSSRPRIPTENEIELYPFFVTIYMCDATSRGEARPFQQNHQLSRVSPVGILLVQLCRELDVDPAAARLWVLGGDPNASADERGGDSWILSPDTNIVDQRKKRGSKDSHGRMALLLEIKDNETGLWPRGVDGKEWSFNDKEKTEENLSELGDGVVGLYNMGNTCYLNSSVQCLSHTPIFREYFTSRGYLKDINTTNPLGHKGQLAQVSAVLINSLWKRFNQTQSHTPKRVTTPGSYALVSAPALTPKTFKDSLGKFNDHFSGNEQHDAQELLAFLLGGLSEDLNRIVDKPYIEAPDSDGRPDSELADIWWSNHLKREMSIIVALFTGQYKSLLTCRSCKYESARFEPFSFLQLPLPEDDHHSVMLVLYPRKEGSDPTKYSVRVHVDGKLGDVLFALAKVLHDDEVATEKPSQLENNTGTPSEEDAPAVPDEVYRTRARDLAVVDMRDGYISKIAPKTWSLQDLQNKDSGELPLLHIFELDPTIKTSDTPTGNNEQKRAEVGADGDDVAESSFDDGPPRSKTAFLAVAQRRTEVTSRNNLHPLAHRVFGTPLLIRVNNFDTLTGRKLYDLVAQRLKNVVPLGACRFLSGGSTAKGSSKPQSKQTQTYTDMEEVSAGPVPRFGFRLRLTTRDGRRCLSCPWYKCCIGCAIFDDDSPTAVMDGDSIVVDWHFAVDVATSGFGLRANQTDPLIGQSTPSSRAPRVPPIPIKNHSSCARGKKSGGQSGAITLEECLDAFAKEERIPEAYCSKCKDFRVQTKRMSLWRLPPVVIIHLKRFQFTQHMRRKLRDLVVFPVEGLDLSRIMAQESMDAAVKTEGEAQPETNGSVSSREKVTDDEKSNGEASSDDGAAVEDHLKDNGRSEKLYDLYGVVHHQGALSGGHYVASLKSELDGQWRLFNDAQIYDIHARDVVDASAYILFYIRRDVSKAQLSDFWDIREGEGISEEDMDELIKGRSERCVIS